MLLDSGLPLEFWAEALTHRTWLWNRTLTANREEIPELAFCGNQKALSELTSVPTLGCLAYACENPKQRLRKFSPRGYIGIFLGKAEKEKAFRIWNVGQKRIDIARSVDFDMDRFPAAELAMDPRSEMHHLAGKGKGMMESIGGRLPIEGGGQQSEDEKAISLRERNYLIMEGPGGLAESPCTPIVTVDAPTIEGGDDLGEDSLHPSDSSDCGKESFLFSDL